MVFKVFESLYTAFAMLLRAPNGVRTAWSSVTARNRGLGRTLARSAASSLEDLRVGWAPICSEFFEDFRSGRNAATSRRAPQKP